MNTILKLSDGQRTLLFQASQHEARLAPLPKLPKAAANAVLSSLIKKGLLAECPAPRAHIGRAWRQDEGGVWIALRITEEGMRAIGVEPPEEAAVADRLPADGQSIDESGTDQLAADEKQAEAPQEAAPAPAAEDRIPRSLRDAARRVLDAWDDEANQRYDLTDAMDALRTALAGKPTRRPARPRPPRQGTKLLTVVALLKQPGGTTVAQVCEATGWTKDTVRGFFVGLKKKGIRVEAVEKVRSVGPNRAGGRGSYTIYRVAEAGDA
jgi:hypothetical protein